MKVALGALLAYSAVAFSQAPSAPKKAPIAPNASDIAIADLRRQIAELQKLIEAKDETVWSVLRTHMDDIGDLKHATVDLDPSNPGPYQRVDTVIGPLLVSMGKVEPYLDGQKVNLLIGNPLAIRFEGFKISAEYAPRQGVTKWIEWFKKIKKKEFNLTQPLLSGQWNSVELIFPDTKAEVFGFLSISISINSVSFK